MQEDNELIKYFLKSEIREMMRSEMHPAPYNPRKIDDEGKKLLKRSIKNFGVLGGIIVNEQTGYTIVGGHQKVLVLDEINKYEEGENDYKLRVEVINVDEAEEKTINTALNNPRIGGMWDYDKLKVLVPDIDYKNAGLTEEDLSMIGVDYIFRSEDENNLASEIGDLMAEVEEEHKQEVQQRKQEREALKEAQKAQPMTFEEKTQHMKDVKQQVKEQAIEKASNMEAYYMLSFDNWQSKQDFAARFGLDPTTKFIKGEDLLNKIEGYDLEDEDYEE